MKIKLLAPQERKQHLGGPTTFNLDSLGKGQWLSACRVLGGFVVVQSLSLIQLSATPWTAACQASLSFTISQSLLKFTPIASEVPSNHLILCHPLLLLPSICPGIKVFSNESALPIRWLKYWSCSFSISPSSEYLEYLISFRIDWFALLAVQGMLKSLFQHNLKASMLWRCSVLSLLYGPALTAIPPYTWG